MFILILLLSWFLYILYDFCIIKRIPTFYETRTGISNNWHIIPRNKHTVDNKLSVFLKNIW